MPRRRLNLLRGPRSVRISIPNRNTSPVRGPQAPLEYRGRNVSAMRGKRRQGRTVRQMSDQELDARALAGEARAEQQISVRAMRSIDLMVHRAPGSYVPEGDEPVPLHEREDMHPCGCLIIRGADGVRLPCEGHVAWEPVPLTAPDVSTHDIPTTGTTDLGEIAADIPLFIWDDFDDEDLISLMEG